MALCWVTLWSVLLPPALLSGPDRCTVEEISSLQSESPLLKSLQCYNDYQSFVHCKWSKDKNTMLQLWFVSDEKRERCLPYNGTTQDGTEPGTDQCRYESKDFFIGIKHTVYFLQKATETLCSSVSQKPLDLSQHLKAKPPVGLSFRDAGDGGSRLTWSSPYPPSSSLNKNIAYQVSYRGDGESHWVTQNVTNTSMTLKKQSLLSGWKYEARVRARVSVGQWSRWSPVLAFQTVNGTWQIPRLHCVLAGEEEVVCSWEVSAEVAHFITHQLACRRNQTARLERCCERPTVHSSHDGTVLKYSCTLTVENPASLLLELQPAHNAKMFSVSHHIRPLPPQQVKVRDKGSGWLVEWAASSPTSVTLHYQVCYCKKQEQECLVQNIPAGSMSLTILQSSLDPSQDYQVRVRSLVKPEDNYSGIPSEWSDPVDWTSHAVTWSLQTFIYVLIAMFAATVFLTIYCTVPACRRRAILWVESVPTPAKSKILSEIKSTYTWTLMQSETPFVCKVHQLDSLSTCSSDVSLWQNKSSERKCLDRYEGCWKCDNDPAPAEGESSPVKMSSVSFSGPYIWARQASESNITPVDTESEESQPLSDDCTSPPPLDFNLYGKGYVCLPKCSISRSTQDLVSHSHANTNTPEPDGAKQDHPDTTQQSVERDFEPVAPTCSPQPLAHISGPTAGWPQGDTIQTSGYCHLPPGAHMTAEC